MNKLDILENFTPPILSIDTEYGLLSGDESMRKATCEHAPTSNHNHILQIMELLKCLVSMELEPEAIISFYVIHRDWCRIYQNEFCNCDATVSTVPLGFHKIRNAMLRRARELKDVQL